MRPMARQTTPGGNCAVSLMVMAGEPGVVTSIFTGNPELFFTNLLVTVAPAGHKALSSACAACASIKARNTSAVRSISIGPPV